MKFLDDFVEGEDDGGKIGPNFSKGCEMTLDFDNGDVFCEKKVRFFVRLISYFIISLSHSHIHFILCL